ncbi:MAG: cupin domain-containing protein [Chryseolinea sp.]
MNSKPASYWINHLNLKPHPEGGFYKETYRSEGVLSHAHEAIVGGARNYSTAIYFLLRGEDKSNFHRIKSDEIWHFHAGDTLTIYVLSKDGLISYRLGDNLDAGDQLQVIIPANHWFGAKLSEGSYTLAGCTVAPGFDFRDFELAASKDLLKEFPDEQEIIASLTLD